MNHPTYCPECGAPVLDGGQHANLEPRIVYDSAPIARMLNALIPLAKQRLELYPNAYPAAWSEIQAAEAYLKDLGQNR